MSTKLITHGDLDGGGCAVMVLKFHNPEADVVYCDYDRIDEEVLSFMEAPTHSELFLTDISPTYEVFEKLVKRADAPETPFAYRIVDHHKSRHWLGGVPSSWITFDTSVSATELVAQVLGATAGFKSFAQVVTAYDLWLKQSPLRKESEELNDLFFFLGRQDFVANAVVDPQFYRNAQFHYIAERLAAQRERTVAGVIKKQLGDDPEVYTSREGHTYLMVVANQYASELGDRILVDYPHVGFAAVVNVPFNKVELRAREGETDVSKIAAVRGGGGHQAAAGFQFPSFSDLAKAAARGVL